MIASAASCGRCDRPLQAFSMARQERSAGFVLYFRPPDGGASRFLLLDYGKHWDFPKGHVEKGEDDITAARREVREETGISEIRLVPGFHREIIYFFRNRRRDLVRKVVVFFLGEVQTTEVQISDEHVGFAFLPLAEAIDRLTYATARQLLELAEEQLRRG